MERDAARRALNGIHLDELQKNMPNLSDLQKQLGDLKRSAPSDEDMQKMKDQLNNLNQQMAVEPKQPE